MKAEYKTLTKNCKYFKDFYFCLELLVVELHENPGKESGEREEAYWDKILWNRGRSVSYSLICENLM